jgi:hypothetical protein
MKENKFLLVSVKSKSSQSQNQGQVYVVPQEDISLFIEKVLDEDSILLIDSVDTFVSKSSSID